MKCALKNIVVALTCCTAPAAHADDLFGGGSGRDAGGLYERGNTQQRVESEMDRGTGRIVDQQTYELDRIEQLQRDDLRAADLRAVDLLEQDRDREDRIAANQRRAALERRWEELMQPPAPRSISSLPPVFGSSLLSWIIDSAAISATQPASAPADR